MRIFTQHLEKLHSYKELLVTTCVIVLCLILSVTFPVDNTFQSISRSIFFLVVLPMLYIKLVLKANLSDWGWNLANKKEGAILAALAFLAGLIIFYLIVRFTGFASQYPLDPLVKNNFLFYLLYELVFFNIFFFTQEFFFQGFVLFSFRQFSVWTVFIQAGIYFGLLLLSKSLFSQIAPLLFFSIIGGLITYKTRSFFYSYISGFLFIIILDAYIIHLVK